MNIFLRQVSQRLSEEFVVMVVDGGPSHRSVQLEIPEDMILSCFPSCSLELKQAEHLWDEQCEI